MHQGCRLAHGGARLWLEGKQGVDHVSGCAPQQRAEPLLPPGSENLRTWLLGSCQAFSTGGLDHKQQLTHLDFEVVESCWSPHHRCSHLGSCYYRSQEEQPKQDEGSRKSCGSRSKTRR